MNTVWIWFGKKYFFNNFQEFIEFINNIIQIITFFVFHIKKWRQLSCFHPFLTKLWNILHVSLMLPLLSSGTLL